MSAPWCAPPAVLVDFAGVFHVLPALVLARLLLTVVLATHGTAPECSGSARRRGGLRRSPLVLHLALVTYTVRLHQLPALHLGVVLGLARESPDISVCLPVLLRGWGWTDTL